MSEESLQFQRAEYAQPVNARVECASCRQEVVQSYYEIGGSIICSACRERRDHAMEGWGGGRFVRALVAGLGAGILGAAVWYAVRAITDYELAIISIGIGYAVGKAVRWGSRGKGGWLYQLLAVFLTYSAIVSTYVPLIVKSAMEGQTGSPSPLLYVVAFVISYAAPFLAGLENIVGLLIIAFGLWEAWKFNRRVEAVVTGPYTVTPAATVPAANV